MALIGVWDVWFAQYYTPSRYEIITFHSIVQLDKQGQETEYKTILTKKLK